VTLITGALATIAAMFPALAMKLLDFVALYGLVLMPMGAVVFMDFWVIPKLGLRSSYAALSGRHFNWAAGAAWAATLAICLGIVFVVGRWTLWFVALPGWFIASLVYLGLSRVYQRQTVPSPAQPRVQPGTAQA
jgi:cytosine/uracil/thiamine/allantoin permease